MILQETRGKLLGLMILNGFPLSAAGDEHMRNKRRWNHKFWLVLWMFALPLTKQGTTATSSPKKTTTNQIPSKPHHLFPCPPKKKQPRIPHQATMAWTKSNPSVHQSSAWNSAPTPIGAVSIFGGASQIKSKDLTDFGRFWKPTLHNQWQDMVGWCFGALFLLSLYVGHSLKHLTTSPQCSWLQGSSFKWFRSIAQEWFSSLVEILLMAWCGSTGYCLMPGLPPSNPFRSLPRKKKLFIFHRKGHVAFGSEFWSNISNNNYSH